MGFPKFHGIALAANSWIDNLHVERLAADPALVNAGRVWFNIPQKALKFTTLDAGGAVVARVIADSAELTAAIAALQADLDTTAAALDGAITDEVAARIAAIDALTAALATEVADRIAAVAAEAVLRTDGDATEAAARVSADAVAAATASDQLATETAARLAGDAALGGRVDDVQAELNVTQAASGFEVDGSYVAPLASTYLGAATSLKTADVALDAAITAEVAARIGQTAALSSGLANEAQTRADADIALQAQITAYIDSAVTNNTNADNAETIARIAADAAIKAELDLTQATIGTAPDGSLIPITGTNYLNEVTTVFGGAFVLDTQVKLAHDLIAAEVAGRTAADVTINAALQAEVVARGAGVDALQQELNSTQAGAGLETDGSYVAPTLSNYLDTSTSLKDAQFVLDAALRVAEDKVDLVNSVAIPALQAATAAEATRALAAEAVIVAAATAAATVAADATAAEATRALAAEGVLTAAVASEAADRQSAVTVVNNAVVAEAARATAAEVVLQAAIDAVEAAAGGGAAALQTTLNAGRFNFASVAPSLTHTVQHDMGTPFVQYTVMIEGGDGVYRNDIVPVEEIAGGDNALLITLTEARNIRVAVTSNAILA